jgi:hypothetical protein
MVPHYILHLSSLRNIVRYHSTNQGSCPIQFKYFLVFKFFFFQKSHKFHHTESESGRENGTLQTLVDSLTPYSQRFLFDLRLRVKGRTGNLFPHRKK